VVIVVVVSFKEAIVMQDPIRRLRHDILGRLNAIKLATQVLPMVEPHEVDDFASQIVTSADELVDLLDELESQLPDAIPTST
jgi:nitrogen-specific signal transduction histidine kinase